MSLTLISMSNLDAAGYAALFCDSCCKIFNARKKLLGVILVSKGLYTVNAPQTSYAGIASAEEPLTMEEIHVRLGHITPESIQQMLKASTITGIKPDPGHTMMGSCNSCKYAKATRKHVGKVRNPPRHMQLHDETSKYFASFTDDHTWFTNLHLLKSKDQTFDAYKKYEAWLGTQFDVKVKCLHLDHGGEYLITLPTKGLSNNSPCIIPQSTMVLPNN
ncbi:hypothetical protein ID866_10649 [Astraeus odoratus]|nr:hypothetical protein ID866_10649 [Astraeus odoratus]